MLNRRLGGFTLIELMITLAVLGVLISLAMPSFRTLIANAKVRSVAEGLQNGLRKAQGEAITRSRQTTFVLTNALPALSATPAANGSSWYIQILPLTNSSENVSDASNYIQGDSTARQQSASITGGAVLCFNSAGRLVTNETVGCVAPASSVTYAVSATGADRPMSVQVFLGGKVRMCDPSKTWSTTNPDGCS